MESLDNLLFRIDARTRRAMDIVLEPLVGALTLADQTPQWGDDAPFGVALPPTVFGGGLRDGMLHILPADLDVLVPKDQKIPSNWARLEDDDVPGYTAIEGYSFASRADISSDGYMTTEQNVVFRSLGHYGVPGLRIAVHLITTDSLLWTPQSFVEAQDFGFNQVSYDGRTLRVTRAFRKDLDGSSLTWTKAQGEKPTAKAKARADHLAKPRELAVIWPFEASAKDRPDYHEH